MRLIVVFGVLFVLLSLLFISGCAKDTVEQKQGGSEGQQKIKEESKEEFKEEKVFGPSGCTSGQECGAYCSKNPFDCDAWCDVADNKKVCNYYGLNIDIPAGIPGAPCVKDGDCQTTLCLDFKCDIPSPANLAKKSGGKLPGGCSSMEECSQQCAQPENTESCQQFCELMPSLCIDLNAIRVMGAPAECKECTTCSSKLCVRDCTYRCYQFTPIPSVSKLDVEQLRSKGELKRVYQMPLKGVWEPGPAYNCMGMMYFADDYKELGVNTYAVTPKYERQKGKLVHTVDHAKGEKADWENVATIIRAKQAGFQVVLVAHDLYDMFPDANKNEKFNPEEYIEEVKATSLKWAKVAEEYNVEYFVPINEFEYVLYENGYSAEKACEITNKLYAEVIPKVREVFKGKIYCRVGGMDGQFGCMDFSLCDVFGFTYGFSGGKNYNTNFEKEFEVGEQLYEKYKIPYVMAEAFALLIQGTTVADCAKLHRAGIHAYKENAVHGKGYTFMGLVQRDPINKNDCTITEAGVVEDYTTFFREMK